MLKWVQNLLDRSKIKDTTKYRYNNVDHYAEVWDGENWVKAEDQLSALLELATQRTMVTKVKK